MQRVELSGDAKAFAQRRFVAVGLGRRDGERAFDAADNEAVAADRQLRQRDPRARRRSVRRAGRAARPPQARRPIRRRRRLRARSERRSCRGCRATARRAAARAQHEREGQAARAASRRRAGSGFRAPGPRLRHRGRRAASSAILVSAETIVRLPRRQTIPRRCPPRRRKLVDRLDGGRSGMKTAARGRRSATMSEERARRRTRSASASHRSGRLGSCVSMRIRHAIPARGGGKRTSCIVAGAVHGHGGAIDAVALRRREDGDEDRALGHRSTRLCHRAIGVAPFDVGEPARVERRRRSGTRRATARHWRGEPRSGAR